MKRTLSVCWGLVVVGMLAGCNAAWESFKAVSLGQSIPADSVLRQGQEGTDLSREWQDVATLPFPIAAGGYSVRVLVDQQGTVTGKAYFALAYAHWVVFQAIACRQVIEFLVPEEMAPSLGSPANQPDLHRLVAHLRAESQRLQNWPDMFGNTEHANKLTLTAVYAGMMLAGDRVASMDSLLAQEADSLGGIFRAGFDKTISPVCGVTFRVRNLDGRRIRADLRACNEIK